MNSTIEALITIFDRDLDRLITEINAYQNESDLWKIDKQISNTAGNLCLHLCGNLQQFFGHVINGTDYVRQREDEFNLKNVPRTELIELVEKSRVAVKDALNALDPTLLDKLLPIEPLGRPMTHVSFVIHLSGHLNYHLGQINYHRRLLAES